MPDKNGRLTADELAAKYAAKQKELSDKGGDWDSFWASLSDGKNYLRFFPNPSDGGFFLEGGNHNNLHLLDMKHQDGKPVKALLCPKKFDPSLQCPICDLLDTYKKSKNTKEKTLYKKCRAKDRYFSWVAVLESGNQTSLGDGEDPKVLAFGAMILQDLLGYWNDPDYGSFIDAKEGRVVIIDKSGTGLDTEYQTKLRPNPTKFLIPDDLEALEDVVKPRDYDVITAMMGLNDFHIISITKDRGCPFC